MLNVSSARKPSGAGRIAFNREIEMVGGSTAGTKVTLTASGFSEFSQEHGMPYAGSVDYEAGGFQYRGYSGAFHLRAGFHLLHGWEKVFFEHGLLPTAQAFDSENLPRLSVQQQQNTLIEALELRVTGGGYDVETNRNIMFMARTAPPPYGSLLQQKADELLAQYQQAKAQQKAKASETPNDGPANLLVRKKWANLSSISHIFDRWAMLREMATLFPRTWSDASGSFSVDAKLVSHDDDLVTLERVDNGKRIRVPLGRLCEDDVGFAKTFGKPL